MQENIGNFVGTRCSFPQLLCLPIHVQWRCDFVGTLYAYTYMQLCGHSVLFPANIMSTYMRTRCTSMPTQAMRLWRQSICKKTRCVSTKAIVHILHIVHPSDLAFCGLQCTRTLQTESDSLCIGIHVYVYI